MDAASQIMPVAGGGCDQGYNAQAVVANATLWVLAPQVTQAVNDQHQIGPLLERVQVLPAGLNQSEQLLADTGYFSPDHVAACEQAGIEPLIAVKRDHPPMGPRAAANPKNCRPTRPRA